MRNALRMFVLAAALSAQATMARDAWHVPDRGDPRQGGDVGAAGRDACGPGFIKLQGTDSCVRVGGSLATEATVRSGGGSLRPGP